MDNKFAIINKDGKYLINMFDVDFSKVKTELVAYTFFNPQFSEYTEKSLILDSKAEAEEVLEDFKIMFEENLEEIKEMNLKIIQLEK